MVIAVLAVATAAVVATLLRRVPPITGKETGREEEMVLMDHEPTPQ
ncbi:hypothetical protein [Streptomyces sp. CMB-StM0423]|nr:hypothetical protein [Streptomyces sp. CMB-StM0423]